MGVLAKRFDFLDKETNKGLNDFINVTDSDIRNVMPVDVEEVSATISDMLVPLTDVSDLTRINQDLISADFKSNLQGMMPDIDLKSFDAKSLFRESKDVLGIMGNMSKLPDKLFDNMLGALFPNNPTAKNLAKSVFKTCGSLGSGFGNLRPFDTGVDCNGNSLMGSKGNCKPSGISSLLNALTGGAYGKGFGDINNLINAVVALITGSYKANLCGGFNASIGGLGNNKPAINRSGVLAMSGLAAIHSVRGSLDIINGTDSFDVGNQLPNAVKYLVGNPNIKDSEYGIDGLSKFKDQFGIDDRGLGGVYMGIKTGASLLDTKWDVSSSDLTTPSIASIVDSGIDSLDINKGYASLAQNALNNIPLSTDSLTTINDSVSDSFDMVCGSFA